MGRRSIARRQQLAARQRQWHRRQTRTHGQTERVSLSHYLAVPPLPPVLLLLPAAPAGATAATTGAGTGAALALAAPPPSPAPSSSSASSTSSTYSRRLPGSSEMPMITPRRPPPPAPPQPDAPPSAPSLRLDATEAIRALMSVRKGPGGLLPSPLTPPTPPARLSPLSTGTSVWSMLCSTWRSVFGPRRGRLAALGSTSGSAAHRTILTSFSARGARGGRGLAGMTGLTKQPHSPMIFVCSSRCVKARFVPSSETISVSPGRGRERGMGGDSEQQVTSTDLS